MKHTGSVKKKSKSNGYSARKLTGTQYVVCVKNKDYPASLELRKLYQVIHDKDAAKSDLVRIIDESGEDYLYPADYFVSMKLPRTVAKAVQLAS